jgi:TRAP-type C4-dicarboxylate transport system permease small subunit
LSRSVSLWGLRFGGALIFSAAIVVSIEIVIRKLFSISIGGADELSGYALAIGTAWALGAALIERLHIRIDSLYLLLPIVLRALHDVVGLLAFVVVFGLIAWHGIGVVEQSIVAGSRSMSGIETPLALPQGLWLIGMALFLATGVMLLVRSLGRLARGNVEGVIGDIGVRTAEEEALDEVRAAEAVHERERERGA